LLFDFSNNNAEFTGFIKINPALVDMAKSRTFKKNSLYSIIFVSASGKYLGLFWCTFQKNKHKKMTLPLIAVGPKS